MTQYYSQLTAYGEKYIAKQISNGKPLNFATMAVGDGNGQNTTPTATQTTLVVASQKNCEKKPLKLRK